MNIKHCQIKQEINKIWIQSFFVMNLIEWKNYLFLSYMIERVSLIELAGINPRMLTSLIKRQRQSRFRLTRKIIFYNFIIYFSLFSASSIYSYNSQLFFLIFILLLEIVISEILFIIFFFFASSSSSFSFSYSFQIPFTFIRISTKFIDGIVISKSYIVGAQKKRSD